MKLDDLRESINVDDRRGRGGGGLAIGGGGLGVVIMIILALVFGVDPRELLGSMEGGGITGPAEKSEPGAPREDDAEFSFSRKIIASTEDVWTEIFQEQGRRYEPAIFTAYDHATQTAGCGGGQAAMGPFYCPADNRIYIDLSFFRELSGRFGAPGDFARAYVIAHEVGHHVQNLMGTSDDAQRRMQRSGEREANRISVRLELQADCYAGVWANRANRRDQILEPGDVEEGLAAANAVGDDTLQGAGGGRVSPDSFTHGSSAQRMEWFKRGFDTGDVNACDTFRSSR